MSWLSIHKGVLGLNSKVKHHRSVHSDTHLQYHRILTVYSILLYIWSQSWLSLLKDPCSATNRAWNVTWQYVIPWDSLSISHTYRVRDGDVQIHMVHSLCVHQKRVRVLQEISAICSDLLTPKSAIKSELFFHFVFTKWRNLKRHLK